MLTDLKNGMEKQNRYSLDWLHQVEFLLVYLRVWAIAWESSAMCIACGHLPLWIQQSQFLAEDGESTCLKSSSDETCVPAFPFSNYWSWCKHENYKRLLFNWLMNNYKHEIVAKFKNTSFGHVKTIRTELIFLIPWGIIHKVSLWILRKVSKIKYYYQHE